MGSAREAAVDSLVRLLDEARPMPLMRNRVRVDKADADALLAIILRHDDEIGVSNADINTAVERLRAALQDAYPVPLTDQVRLPQVLVRELVDALRTAAVHET